MTPRTMSKISEEAPVSPVEIAAPTYSKSNAAPPPPSPSSLQPAPFSRKQFPSTSLILINVLSCFVATTAFISSIVSFEPPVIVPTSIAFSLTVPYHVYLYRAVWKHRRSPENSDPICITPTLITFGFLLVPLWVIVFFLDIILCDYYVYLLAPIVTTTVWSALEWLILLFNALKCAHEVWRTEKATLSAIEQQISTVGAAGDLVADYPDLSEGSKPRPRHVFLLSFFLCTLILVLSANLTPVALFNLIAFLVTAPHHIAVYVASLRPRDAPAFARPLGVPAAFALSLMWCLVFLLDIMLAEDLWRRIVTGLFAVVEALIVIGLAARCVLDNLAEGNIRI
ncbi:hypothetical protein H0H81_011702 [Sphagnurus paluster]|uniref:Transmembrane protein n=1 Tax=Sphagnurus paluster TaxID=117069 RepID=A0A9P7FS91_9AGAR|nr:hypothetical protein H0H81_011702 [Sphagnurus paluster]